MAAPPPLIVADMLTMTGFVSLAAPAHEGTATLDRVTMTSVGAATQWGVTVRVVVGVGVEGDWLTLHVFVSVYR